MPEVSVVIPNYNHALYLKQRIESVINQTFPDLEIIILDDASTDNSLDIIEAYRNHPRVSQIVINKQNTGSTFKQWEKGIGLAHGKWIWIAESDDWCEPGFLENLAPAFNAAASCTVAFCQSLIVDSSGSIVVNSSNSVIEEIVEGRQFITERMLYGNAIFNASMAVFKKENYLRLTKRYTGYRYCGDWLFWIEMAGQGQVYISGKILNYFRKHDKDISSRAFVSGLFYTEYLQLAEDLYAADYIGAEQKRKMIKANFSRYYFQTIPDATVKTTLTASYKQQLRAGYYFISTRLLCQRLKKGIFSIAQAAKKMVYQQQPNECK